MIVTAVAAGALALSACASSGSSTSGTAEGDSAGTSAASGGPPTQVEFAGEWWLGQAIALPGEGTGSECSGYDRLGAGMRVIVRDAAGDVVGSGKLEKGQLQEVESKSKEWGNGWVCRLPFSIGQVAASDFYSVTIEGSECPKDSGEECTVEAIPLDSVTSGNRRAPDGTVLFSLPLEVVFEWCGASSCTEWKMKDYKP
jgi:hypothetical protein